MRYWPWWTWLGGLLAASLARRADAPDGVILVLLCLALPGFLMLKGRLLELIFTERP